MNKMMLVALLSLACSSAVLADVPAEEEVTVAVDGSEEAEGQPAVEEEQPERSEENSN